MSGLSVIVWAFAITVWIYVIARVVTRAVLRTLDERKCHGQEE